MESHPFTESITRKATSLLGLGLTLCMLWGLLTFYGGIPSPEALIDSVIYIGLLALTTYLSWYVVSYMQVWQARLALAILIQAVCLGNCYIFLVFTGLEDKEAFLFILPMRFVLGMLLWTILFMWYLMQQKKEDTLIDEPMAKDVIPTVETQEVIDRISVKDGARIHIIHLEELCFIQASGDYVTLFTTSGQYIKEQTMKYFEQHLPSSVFIRIHRSCIVNAEQIIRVELFGKENYQVRLKNGSMLKASNTGYKLLKERLSM